MTCKFSAEASVPQPSVLRGDGYEISAVNEMIPGTLEWQKKDRNVSLILHLGGNIHEIESEFDGRGMRLDPPMAGEIWLVPANVEYTTRVKGNSASYIEILLDLTTDESIRGNGGLNELTPVAGGFDKVLMDLMIGLYQLNGRQDNLSEIRREESVSSIIDRIVERFAPEPSPKTLRDISFSPEVRNRLETFLLTHLSEQITLERLCRIAEETPHRFLWAFRNAFGSTPAQYLLEQRVRRARHLLQTTQKDITTVAMETGFADHSHFSTTFKRRTGTTPSQYRSSI